jgi:hypothetical protein
VTTPSMGTVACDVWPVQWICDLTPAQIAVTGVALEFASNTLWALSGRQFGLCTVTLRPCRRDCYGTTWPFGVDTAVGSYAGQTYPTPYWWNGQWFNLACPACLTDCSCSVVSEFVLPAPVYRITQIKIDGSPLVTGSYRLDDSRLVVRTDGGAWPVCNDLSKNDTATGTWSVTAQYGQPVPPSASIAVGQLACEVAKAIVGDDCALSQPVQSLARQGVNLTFLDPNEVFAERRTGLRLTDMFISTFNPYGLARRSAAYDIDGPNPRRTG